MSLVRFPVAPHESAFQIPEGHFSFIKYLLENHHPRLIAQHHTCTKASVDDEAKLPHHPRESASKGHSSPIGVDVDFRFSIKVPSAGSIWKTNNSDTTLCGNQNFFDNQRFNPQNYKTGNPGLFLSHSYLDRIF